VQNGCKVRIESTLGIKEGEWMHTELDVMWVLIAVFGTASIALVVWWRISVRRLYREIEKEKKGGLE